MKRQKDNYFVSIMNPTISKPQEYKILDEFVHELAKDPRVKKVNLSFTKPGLFDTYYYEIINEQGKTEKVFILHIQDITDELMSNNLSYTIGAIDGKIKRELKDQGIDISEFDILNFINIHTEEYKNLGMGVAVRYTFSLVTQLLATEVQQFSLLISNVFANEEIKGKMDGMLETISQTFGLTRVTYTMKSVSLENVLEQGKLPNLDYFHENTLGDQIPILATNQ